MGRKRRKTAAANGPYSASSGPGGTGIPPETLSARPVLPRRGRWHISGGVDRKRWAVIRRRVFDRDGWRCRNCGRSGRLECDHIRPVKWGGAVYDMANLQTLCRECHIAKTRAENRQNWPERDAWAALVAERRQHG